MPPSNRASLPGGNEPGLCEHPLRADVLVTGRRSECPQPILLARKQAQILQRGSRHTTTGDPPWNAKTNVRGPIRKLVEIEATHDVAILIDEHVKNATTPASWSAEQCTMSLSELLVEIVATIVDRLGEVGPVRLFKREDRCFVIRAEKLQFEHPSRVPLA